MGILLYEMKDMIRQKIGELMGWISFDYYVVDENLLRIIGTGTYEKFVGFNLPLGSATEYVMRTQEVFLLQKAFGHEICKNCPTRCACMGESMIIYPILLKGKSIGALAIGAFSEEKKEELRVNQGKLIAYIGNVVEFIATKAGERILESRMHFLMNNVSEGIILTDSKGDIYSSNAMIKELFPVGENEFRNVNDLIPEYDVHKLISSGQMQEKGELTVCLAYVDRKVYMQIKPVEPDKFKSDLLFVFRMEVENMFGEANEFVDLTKSNGRISEIKGSSSQINRVKSLMVSASRHDSNVLIRGESGTGKELFARAIHQLSVRSDGPFIAVNCAAIPENLLESELFGYESGAFTGANKNGKLGKFEMANQGTLFLDEIGDMAVHLQPKLLRAIEYGQIEKVGGTKTVNLNIRIIAATNRNLEDMVGDGKFREDLYYRLNVIPMFIPPLRSRREDVLTLARYFLDRFNKKTSKRIGDLSEQIERELLLYDWPGNVRELENTIEYAVLAETSDKLQFSSLPSKFKEHGQHTAEKSRLLSSKQLEHNLIVSLIEKHGLSIEGKMKIADAAGLSLSTLYRRLRSMKDS